MTINMSFSVGDLSLSQDQLDAIKNGQSVDPDEMYFQYLCTTGDGSHDPDGAPDDRVRPSHAALHGTIWRVDDPTAPVPPIDFGCRCGMRYVAAPNTTLSKLVDPVKKELQTLPENFSGWLDQNVKNWRDIARKIEKKPPADRLGLTYLELQKQGGKGDLRDIARMILIGGIL